MKIREVYCQFFKAYARRNGVGNEAIAEGIDLWICRNGLLEDFSEEYREKLCGTLPPFGGVETYLLLLGELEQLYGGKRERNTQKTHDYYTTTLHHLTKDKHHHLGQLHTFR